MTFEVAYRQTYEWQVKTFGPHHKALGLIDHIQKELVEIEQQPNDLEEWIDLMFLSWGGASDCVKAHFPKASPKEIVSVVLSAFKSKLKKNKNRKWPDWRTAERGKAIEHIKEEV